MTRLIPFKKEHLEVMDIRPHELSILSHNKHLNLLESNISVTAFKDGRIIACGGVVPFGNGNAEIWQIPSIYVAENVKEYVIVLRDWLWSVRRDLALTRMQTSCLDDALHNGWMKYLGFLREGTMVKYHDGMNYALYGRTEWD